MPNSLLLVDDEPQMIEMLGDYLASSGYDVHFAVDGETALEQLAQHECNLVITDLGMPKMGGDMLFIIARERGYRMPFVAISGHGGDPALARKLRADGFADVIGKPFEVRNILEAVKRLMQ